MLTRDVVLSVSYMRMKQKDILDFPSWLARQLPDPTQIVRGTLLRRTIRHARGLSEVLAGGGHEP